MTKNEKEIIDKFYKETWCELSVKDGKFYYDGNLDLVGNKIISQLPDNLTVNGFLDLNSSSIIDLPNNLTVNGFWHYAVLMSQNCQKI